MKIRIGGKPVDLRHFVYATGIWAILSAGLLWFFEKEPIPALRTWAIYFVLVVSDLFFLVKTIAAALHLMSDQGAKNRSAYAIQAAVFGALKLVCLGAIGFVTWKYPNAPRSGIFLGLSAIFVVPLAGGFFWSQQQVNEDQQQ